MVETPGWGCDHFFVHGFIYALWSLRKREQNENAKRETETERQMKGTQ